MALVIIIGLLPIFILYTIGVFVIGYGRGYDSGFDDAKMMFLANETEGSDTE